MSKKNRSRNNNRNQPVKETNPQKIGFTEEILGCQSEDELLACVESLEHEATRNALASHYKAAWQAKMNVVTGKRGGGTASFKTDLLPQFMESIEKMNVYKSTSDIGYVPLTDETAEEETTTKKVVETAKATGKGPKGKIGTFKNRTKLIDLQDMLKRFDEMLNNEVIGENSEDFKAFKTDLAELCVPAEESITLREYLGGIVAAAENQASAAASQSSEGGTLSPEHQAVVELMKEQGLPQAAIDAAVDKLPLVPVDGVADDYPVALTDGAAAAFNILSLLFTTFGCDLTDDEVAQTQARLAEEAAAKAAEKPVRQSRR